MTEANTGTRGQIAAAKMLDRLGRWWWWVMLGIAVLWGMATWPAPSASRGAVTWLSHALVAAPPDRQPTHRAVQLPHAWREDGLPTSGGGRYASRFVVRPAQLEDARHRPWALRFDRLCQSHVIRLNGEHLHVTTTDSRALSFPAGYLINVPAALLRTGENTLQVDVGCKAQGGMSLPLIGPTIDLRGEFVQRQILARWVPVGLNLACVTFSLFLVALWWQRRQERAIGLFGALYMITALRNASYFVEVDLGTAPEFDSWMHLSAHTASVWLIGRFAMAFTGQQRRGYERVLDLAGASFPLLALALCAWDPMLDTVRRVLQPALIALSLPALVILLRDRTSGQAVPQRYLAVGLACVLIAGLHDYLAIRQMGHIEALPWIAWAIPLGLAPFTLVVVGRVVQAFNAIEADNATLEQKVQARTQELADANAAKSRFLAAASHDLRQPVAAIGLLNDLLRERLTDHQARDLSERLSHAVVSMESLLKGLLDLSRLDAGTVDVQPRAVPLADLLGDIVSHEAEAARRKGLSLRVHAGQHQAWSDPLLLEQVLRNLVGNAVRHTERGGVLVSARPRAGHLLLQVWDTGPGIPEADQARVFEEFVQLGNPARDRHQGLGLGLAIVRRAVRLLGHTLTLRSRPGHGTCFTLTVPQATTRAETRPPARATAEPTTPTPLPPWRVLLVEDEADIRASLTRLFTGWGLEVRSAASLADARALLAHPCDLAVSDHRLPDGTARDLAGWLADLHPGTPLVIITGDTAPDRLADLARTGLPVLHKPFSAKKMRAMIVETMARVT